MGADILIVDDEPLNLRLLEVQILQLGHQPRLAESGDVALRLLRTTPPDIVILDLMMPGMSGEELLRLMQADRRWQGIPVIVVSAVHHVEKAVECLELGADDFLTKPFQPPLLRARISATLAKLFSRRLGEETRIHRERERLASEMVGAICHNFGQPLTTAQITLCSLAKMEDALAGYIRHLSAKLDPETAGTLRRATEQYFDTRPERDPIQIVETIADCTGDLKLALNEVTDLVARIRDLTNPRTTGYLGQTRILDLDASRRRSLLLVGPEPEAMPLDREALLQAGYACESAPPEGSATEAILHHLPVAILLDGGAPESATSLLTLKERGALPVPIIGVIAAGQDPGAAWRAGLDRVVEGTVESLTPALLEVLTSLPKPSGKAGGDTGGDTEGEGEGEGEGEAEAFE